ncbi:hypothetical protein MOQ_001462 [Trypanosoma cruzi marinkellei]|uniref:Uncharacterized protein n=1 Tax=Trypanosoma cruzi marinkellei TaxID=85056 RepID=K2MSQ8_TRYCR|nr:hypothetical protein MOQ_001462 [Trypanosoma cruzi marinkellei]
MESSPSSLNYLRAVQQLQKKTEELEHVLDETRRLERENAALVEEKAALMQEVAQLEAQNRDWRAEFGVLEEQVKRQQRHLQEHIEREAKRLQESSAKSRESGAEMERLQERLRAAEEAKEEGAAMAAQCRRLSREVAALKRELKSAKAKATHYHSTHARTAADSVAMDQIESNALEGVRSEILSFAAENERLINELEAERKARVVAEEGVVNLQQLLQRQRELSDQQQQLAKEELQALNAQNDALLEDVKLLMEREAASRNDVFASGTDAAPYRRVSTVDRGSMTTEVPYAPLWSPSVQRTGAIQPVKQSPAAVDDGISTTTAQAQVRELMEKVRELESKTAEQAFLLREKEANERLLEERAALHAEERRHLRSLLDKATTPEKNSERYKSSHIVRAEADTELSAVLESIIELLRTFVHCAARLRTRLLLQTSNTDSTVLPIVPCREHNSPHLNAIFSHLGGLRYVANIIDEIGEAASKRPKEQIEEQQLEILQKKQTPSRTPEKTIDKTHAQITEGQVSANHKNTPSPQTGFTRYDIDKWLMERKENLKRQLQHANNNNNKGKSSTSSHSNRDYQSGETLEEAANELKKITISHTTSVK